MPLCRRLSGERMAPGWFGPFEFQREVFRLHRFGVVLGRERWQLRSDLPGVEVVRTDLHVGATEAEALRAFGFVVSDEPDPVLGQGPGH